jgi:glucokinase
VIGAIDIGGTKIAVGLVDSTGKVVAKQNAPTASMQKLDIGLAQIGDMLRRLAQDSRVTIDGIGIGCTGRMDEHGALTKNDFLPDWSGANLPEKLSKEFSVSVAIENDADAAALAEVAWGVGIGKSRFIYVTVSTGIGGGIVLDGKLYRGVDGAHPEIGHHVIDPNGPPCFCGARGCWERFASGTAMAEWANTHHVDKDSATSFDAQTICDLASHQVSWAQKVVQREGNYLGVGLANVIMLFAPDMIALGGGMMRSWDLFSQQALEVIQRNCRLGPYQKTQIVPASLDHDIGLMGAARVWMQKSSSSLDPTTK